MIKTENEYEEAVRKKSKSSYRLTMEVPFFLVMFGNNLSGGVTTNILLYMACITSLNYTDHECELLLASGPKSNETMQIENEAQQHVSMVSMIHSLSGAIVPAILSLFLGSWSDKYGRKPLVAWSLLGMSISAYLTVAFAAIRGIDPWWYLITAIPFSLTGGFCALITGALSYMADITTEKERTFRISLLEAGLLSGIIVGTLSSPYLFELIGGVPVLVIVATAYTFAYIFTMVWIAESIKRNEKGGLSSLFDLSLVKDMVQTCVRKRPNKGRRILFLLTVCCAFSVPYTSGLDYLYTRNKLQWSLETFSIFMVVTTLLSVIGLVIGIGVLQKMLKINDLWLTMLSHVSSIFDFIIKAFATVTWHMYLGTSISLFRGLSQPILRSMVSKILPTEDMAKIFSLLSISNVAVPMISVLIFNPLYYATLNDFPGSIYIVCVAMYVLMIVLLCFAKHYMQKYPYKPEKEAIHEQNSIKEESVPAATNL